MTSRYRNSFQASIIPKSYNRQAFKPTKVHRYFDSTLFPEHTLSVKQGLSGIIVDNVIKERIYLKPKMEEHLSDIIN